MALAVAVAAGDVVAEGASEHLDSAQTRDSPQFTQSC